MVGLTVMGSISMGLSNVGWLFGIMDILQRYFRGYDIWPRRVNSQLQRAADSAFVGGEFSDLPLSLSLIKHLGARRVDNPVGFHLFGWITRRVRLRIPLSIRTVQMVWLVSS